MICKKINFDDEDDQTVTEKKNDSSFSEMDEEGPSQFNQIPFLSTVNKQRNQENQRLVQKNENRLSLQSKLMTPLSFGMAKASWVKNCLKTIGIFEQQKIMSLVVESEKSEA